MISKLRFGLLLALIGMFLAGSYSSSPLTAQQILNLVNRDREKHGLSSLSLNPTLNLAALAKADDMINKNYFAHVSPAGTKPWDWFLSLGYNYSYAGENLAEGYTDPYELENSWMSSPAHRANILSPFYSEAGLAVVERNNTNIIVQFFGSKENKVTLRQ
ncbi:MAG: CAP domain-containing protein [Candidatus Doudnabacteria bacterium]